MWQSFLVFGYRKRGEIFQIYKMFTKKMLTNQRGTYNMLTGQQMTERMII